MKKAILAFIVLSFLAVPADACSCLKRSEAQHLASSDAAFDAIVVKVRKTHFNGKQFDVEDRALKGEIATLRVLAVLKGPRQAGDFVEVRTVTECCVCGISVRKNQKWRLYVSGKAPYSLSICSGSRELESAAS